MPALSDEELLERRRRGESYDEIAKADGRSRSVIYRRVQKAAKGNPGAVGARASVHPEAHVDAVRDAPGMDAGESASESPDDPDAADIEAGVRGFNGEALEEEAGAVLLETVSFTPVPATMISRSIRVPASLISIFDAHRARANDPGADFGEWLVALATQSIRDHGHELVYLVPGAVLPVPTEGPSRPPDQDDRLAAAYERHRQQGFEDSYEDWLRQMAGAALESGVQVIDEGEA
jgi:hypothetical protein